MGQEELVWGVDGRHLLSPTAFIQRRPTLACLTSEWSEVSAILLAVNVAGFYGNLKTEPLGPYVLCICEYFFRKCTAFPRRTEIMGTESNETKKEGKPQFQI